MADPTVIRNQVLEVCVRMSSALGRINLNDLPISTFHSGSIESFKAIIIESSVEFQLPTKMSNGQVTGLIEILDDHDHMKLRMHMIVLFLIEIALKRIVFQWQIIQQRAQDYGIAAVKDEKFVMPESMKKSVLDEMSLLLSQHAEQLSQLQVQQLVFEKVMKHEHP